MTKVCVTGKFCKTCGQPWDGPKRPVSRLGLTITQAKMLHYGDKSVRIARSQARLARLLLKNDVVSREQVAKEAAPDAASVHNSAKVALWKFRHHLEELGAPLIIERVSKSTWSLREREL